MTRLSLFVLLVLCGCASVQPFVSAQAPCTANCHVRSNRAFSIWADSSGVGISGFRLYMNKVRKADVPVTELVDGEIRFMLPSIRPGTYVTKIVAYTASGEELAQTETLTIIASPSGK